MSARGTARSAGTRAGTRAGTGRLSFQRQIEEIQRRARANQEMFTRFSIQTAENNRIIRQLLTRGFTSKREGRDVSPAVKEQLEALQQVLLNHEDKNQNLLKQIADILDDAVLLTEQDIKAAKRAEEDVNKIRRFVTGLKTRLARKIAGRTPERRSPTRGGRKTRKNRGKKQKTQKRKHHNKKRKQTQRRKQHKKK